jgi:hypothetical protein
MNHLKATIIRKKYIDITEEQKKNSTLGKLRSKVRPSSSIRSINEVPYAYDLKYENPPLAIYSKPCMKQNLAVQKQTLSKNTTYKTILRNIEQETRDAEDEIMRMTRLEVSKKGRVTKEELNKVFETTRKKVYKRPMTAVNAFKQKQTGTGIFKKESFEEEKEDINQKNKPETQVTKKNDIEVPIKQKITINEPMPVNYANLDSDPLSAGYDPMSITARKRPKSKAATRQGLTSAKAKFKIKVERKVENTAVVNCKNNKKLKLSSIVCPDEKKNMMRKHERMEYEKPLMDKGFQPGSQKSLFPSRKTEQELMIFKEIFIEPKEKELEKLKDRAKVELEQYEMKISTLGPKNKPIKPLALSKNVELNHSNMINSSFHKTKKGAIENYLKAQNEFSSDEDDEEEKFRSTFTHKFNVNEEPDILN